VPDALRAAGWVLETMDERYGKELSQKINDTQWVEDAANNGDRVAARAFGLARRDVDGPTMISHFLGNETAIFRMALRAAGPYVVSVNDNTVIRPLRRLRLNIP